MTHSRMSQAMIFSAAAACLFALSACGGGAQETNLAALDNQLFANKADPALTSAIEDEILVDPALVQQSNANMVRTAEQPLQAPYPPVRNASHPPHGPDGPVAGACGAALQYGPEWAERLPAEFPPYPGGRVTEAAGNNAGNCRMRVVTFTTSHDWRQVLGWYRDVVTRAGFNHEHQQRGADHVLGGVNERTDGAYYIIVTPGQGGSQVALIVNNGR
jgi:hypothetical protein